jgi:hypothetical protein
MFSRARVYSLCSRFFVAKCAAPIAVCAGTLCALLVSGCGDPPAAPSANSKGAAKVADAVTSAADARCQQLITSSLDMMKPENLGITAQEQQVVDALNNWAGECGKSVPTGSNDPPPTAGKGDAFADLYDLSDIEHVRNCWLVRQLGTNAMRSQPTDLDRAVALFDLCVRTVALLGTAEPVFAQTPYDTMVLGRGTAEDRAWLFGELLRQAGIDSVILRPKKSSSQTPGTSTKGDSAAAPWLVGVLLDKQVYLFDPTLGWPIPSPDDKVTSVTVRQPATLAQVVAHDELLRKLDVSPDKKYPLRAADLKSLQVEIISSSRYSEPRIKRLESFLAGNRSTTVYSPMADVSGRPGVKNRVEQGGAGLWKKEDVSLWDYPDRQIGAVHHLDGQAKTHHDEEWLPFAGPVDLEFEMKTMSFKISQGTTFTEVNNGKGSGRSGAGRMPSPGDAERVEVRHDARRQIKARIAQLQGDYPTAVRKYLSVQLAELPPELLFPPDAQEKIKRDLPPEKRPNGPVGQTTPKREFIMNFRAAEAAKFWMGVCQLDQHEGDSADETFTAYLRRYTQGGVGLWVLQAAYLRSLSLAENKKFALAVQAITQLVQALPENDFRRPAFELLSERWRTARDAAKPSPSDTSAESPTQNSPPADAKSADANVKPAAPGKAESKAPSAPKTPAPTPAAPDVKSPAKPKSP